MLFQKKFHPIAQQLRGLVEQLQAVHTTKKGNAGGAPGRKFELRFLAQELEIY